ncbi:MAG TPA: hypothetical protein VJP06_04135 [Thermoplasmata archaeon]|nr:hypothetical protein [Thermoplasmata archaeon]
MRAAMMAGAILGLAAFAAVVLAPSVSGSTKSQFTAVLPARTGVWPVNFTFYGDAARGWSFDNVTFSEPGPRITVFLGDTVNLTLIGADLSGHSWFVDFNNNTQADSSEPASPHFNEPPGTRIVWNFSAGPAGNWTYRCGVHPTSMSGTIVILPQPRPVNLTLYGDAGSGWGFSNTTVREPGPRLVILVGTNVTLTLIGRDLAPHTWFIDYDNNSQVNGAEKDSPRFNDPPRTIVVWSFIADRAGNFTYRCSVHPASMSGLISIVGGPAYLPPSGGVPLVTEILLIGLGVVFVFAVVYQVRAVRAAKRSK